MITRRRFLGGAGAAAFPVVVPGFALGRDGAASPGDRIGVGCAGVGWQGTNNLKSFLELPGARIVAVCDVDSGHLEAAKQTVNDKYGNSDCAAYRQIEEMLARPDIDAVCLSLPDHWHGLASVLAARRGKDIYGEKPLAHNFAEGVAICESVRRYGRVWQTGSWQRSVAQFRYACELVRSGRIGKVRRVEVGLPGGHTDFDGLGHLVAPGPPPAALDYDRWLGPAPLARYCPARVHKTWRWHSDYGGGMLMDWIGHHVDIAHWGLDLDHGGPIEVEGHGEFPPAGVLWDTATRYQVTATYAGGLSMRISGGYGDTRLGTKWIGDEGWLWVDRQGMDGEPKSMLTSKIGPNDVQLPRSPGHQAQFIECVRTRRDTLTPADVALRSATPGYLGVISMRLGRKVRWDPVRQQIVGDVEAARLLERPMRSPWHL
jgi:predicted dehydrogenase